MKVLTKPGVEKLWANVVDKIKTEVDNIAITEKIYNNNKVITPVGTFKDVYLGYIIDSNALQILPSTNGGFLYYLKFDKSKKYKLLFKNSNRCRIAYTNLSFSEMEEAFKNSASYTPLFSTYFFENDNEDIVDIYGNENFGSIIVYSGLNSELALVEMESYEFFNDYKDKESMLEKYGLIKPTENIPSSSTEYHALWDNIVNDGYATRETLCEISDESLSGTEYVYLYHLNINDKYAILDEDPYGFVENNGIYEKPKVLIDSGMHGNEKGSPVFLYEFVNRLCYDQEYSELLYRYDWYIVPLMNPTGFNADTRNNYQDIDINRDNTNLYTLEARALVTLLNNTHYDFFFDVHQLGASGNSSNTPNICSTISIPYGSVQEFASDIYSKFGQAGANVDMGVSGYLGKELSQSCFPWESTNDPTFRNYAKDKADTVACIEFTKYCYKYSGSDIEYNDVSMLFGNTLLDEVLRNLLSNEASSVTISNISESSVSGGNNVVTFSDGKTLTVKNGVKGDVGINWRDEWDEYGSYMNNDAVAYNGSSYYAVASDGITIPDGISPDDDPATWRLLAKKGADGADGFSPTIKITSAAQPDVSGEIITYHTITVHDINGEKSIDIKDGAKGKNGTSSNVKVTQMNDGALIQSAVTDPDGNISSTMAIVENGKDGASVTVKSVSESSADGGSNVVTFSDGKTLTVKNGSKGSIGINWRGEWDYDISYSTGDAVIYNGSAYIANEKAGDNSPTSSNPEINTDGIWDLLAQKGIDGKTPVKGEDYFTTADKEEIAEAAAELVDIPSGYVVQDTEPEDTSVLWVDTDDDSDDGFQEAVNAALAQAKESGEFKGDPGKTPVKGTDYFTTDDKAEMVAAVIAALPVYNGEVV